MRTPNASFNDQNVNRKTILDPTYNPRLVDSERYVRIIVSQKPIKAAPIHNVLKVAWARYGSVKLSKVEDRTMLFEFENDEDRKQILDKSPWDV